MRGGHGGRHNSPPPPPGAQCIRSMGSRNVWLILSTGRYGRSSIAPQQPQTRQQQHKTQPQNSQHAMTRTTRQSRMAEAEAIYQKHRQRRARQDLKLDWSEIRKGRETSRMRCRSAVGYGAPQHQWGMVHCNIEVHLQFTEDEGRNLSISLQRSTKT